MPAPADIEVARRIEILRQASRAAKRSKNTNNKAERCKLTPEFILSYYTKFRDEIYKEV